MDKHTKHIKGALVIITKDLEQEYKDWKEIKEFLVLVKIDLLL
jgi:hypothetical protein